MIQHNRILFLLDKIEISSVPGEKSVQSNDYKDAHPRQENRRIWEIQQRGKNMQKKKESQTVEKYSIQ